METTGEATGLLDKIVPPRIEDAGLEDCALPPESINEALLKAASAVRRHIFSDSDDDSDADCVNDPWTGLGESGDKLLGVSPGSDPPGACAAKKGGGLPEVIGDDVDVPGDKVLEPEVAEEGEACIDGVKGLKIYGKKKEDEEVWDIPILAEVYV